MSGIRDPETRRKLLTYTHPPSLQTTVDVCRSGESARNDEATLASNDRGHTKNRQSWQENINVVNLEIPPRQNTTTDVVIVANRLIKRVINVLHDAVSVQSAKIC